MCRMTCICIRKRLSIVLSEIVTGEKNKAMKNVVGSSEKRVKWICRGSLIERGVNHESRKFYICTPPPRSKTISDRMTTIFFRTCAPRF